MPSVTFDTNVYPLDDTIISKMHKCGFEYAHVTVTDRELQGSDIKTGSAREILETAVWNESFYDKSIYGPVRLAEAWVLGESPLGSCALANQQTVDVQEAILKILSNNSFPPHGKRNSLTPGQRKQMRDAMILTAHVRDKRDVFVSNDEKAFVKNGKKQVLENLLNITIMTKAEFIGHLHEYADERNI